jgi:hypothetical protein
VEVCYPAFMNAVSMHCDAVACWFVRDVNEAFVLCYYASAYTGAIGSVNTVATIGANYATLQGRGNTKEKQLYKCILTF